MKGATKKRGTHGLRKRCPQCKKLRKFCEPPGDQGGEPKTRRPLWTKVSGHWVCGFCTKVDSRDFLSSLSTPLYRTYAEVRRNYKHFFRKAKTKEERENLLGQYKKVMLDMAFPPGKQPRSTSSAWEL